MPNTSKTVADTEANDAKPTKKALELQKKIGIFLSVLLNTCEDKQ